jgi:hypothetical protein
LPGRIKELRWQYVPFLLLKSTILTLQPGPTDVTAVTIYPNVANSSLSMSVIVPGGQRAYVAPTGKLQYTVPHSNNIPEGAVLDGFMCTGDGGRLTFLDNDWFACPIGTVEGQDEPGYEVYSAAAFPGYEPVVGCTTIAIQPAVYTGAAAYEYN